MQIGNTKSPNTELREYTTMLSISNFSPATTTDQTPRLGQNETEKKSKRQKRDMKETLVKETSAIVLG
jgi:hypothetical protein